MTAAEIAETLLNGNIAQARHEILNAGLVEPRTAPYSYDVAVMALAVVAELAQMLYDAQRAASGVCFWSDAHEKVRRCLEGSA